MSNCVIYLGELSSSCKAVVTKLASVLNISTVEVFSYQTCCNINVKANVDNKIFIYEYSGSVSELAEANFVEGGFNIAVCETLDLEFEILLLKCGFRGVVLSSAETYYQLECLKMVLDGKLYFSKEAMSDYILLHNSAPVPKRKLSLIANTTKKEQEVIEFVSTGMSNEEVASKLNVSVNTIKMHMQNIYKKNKIKNRSQLMLMCS